MHTRLPVLDSVDEGDYLAIPDFGGGISDMNVKDVSADGTILVGTGNIKTGLRAFRADTTVVDTDLVPVPVQLVIQDAVTLQTLRSSAAEAVSEDGLIIAGRSDSPKGPVACIWFVDDETTEWVVKSLGALSKKNKDAVATGIAYRSGSLVGELIVVGRSQSILYPSEAFVWTGNPVLEEE